MSVGVEWRGLDRVQQRYANAPAIVTEVLDDTVDTVLAYGIRALSAYPPERPRQRYTRTFALKRGWQQPPRKFRLGRSGLSVSLTNSVPHALIVHGNAQGQGQARIHTGRWPTLQAVEQRIERQIGPQALQKAAVQIGQRLGGR